MKTKIITIVFTALMILDCNNEKKSSVEAEKERVESTSEKVNETTEIPNVENIRWILTTFKGEEVYKLNDTDQDIHFILNSDSNRMRGFLSCNTFVGVYTIENGSSIKFSNLIRGKKACPISAIDEVGLFNVFEMADNFTLKDDKLILNTKMIKSLAEFRKAESFESPIVEKYWKLKTLEGKDIAMVDNQEREIYFTLKTQDNRVNGFAGCNNLSGEYTLEEGNRICFKNIAVTMKACPDVDVNETDFLKVFELADNYTIKDDVLSLNVGRRAPLAVFEAVYMQ